MSLVTPGLVQSHQAIAWGHSRSGGENELADRSPNRLSLLVPPR